MLHENIVYQVKLIFFLKGDSGVVHWQKLSNLRDKQVVIVFFGITYIIYNNYMIILCIIFKIFFRKIIKNIYLYFNYKQ
jgi:hypothetical protein